MELDDETKADLLGAGTEPSQLPAFSEATKIEGWLEKQTLGSKGFQGAWRKRYFILKHSCLFWYKMTQHGEYHLEQISIEDVHGVVATNLGSKIGYQMELVVDEQKRLLLAFDTQADLAAWQQVFNAAGSHAITQAEAEKVTKRGWAFTKSKGKWKYRYLALQNRKLEVFDAEEKGHWMLSGTTVDIYREFKREVKFDNAHRVVTPSSSPSIASLAQASNSSAISSPSGPAVGSPVVASPLSSSPAVATVFATVAWSSAAYTPATSSPAPLLGMHAVLKDKEVEGEKRERGQSMVRQPSPKEEGPPPPTSSPVPIPLPTPANAIQIDQASLLSTNTSNTAASINTPNDEPANGVSWVSFMRATSQPDSPATTSATGSRIGTSSALGSVVLSNVTHTTSNVIHFEPNEKVAGGSDLVWTLRNDKQRLPLRAPNDKLWKLWLTILDEDLRSQPAVLEPTSPDTNKKGTDTKALRFIHRINDAIHQEKGREAARKALILSSPPTKRRNTFNIVSFDGGGLRGIMGAIMLERMVKEFPDLIDNIDMVAGCSNGAILAMGLAVGFSPSLSRALLECTCDTIFGSPGITGGNFRNSKFSPTYLNLLCREVWKKTVREADKFVVIPAMLLDNENPDRSKREWRIKYYHNLDPLDKAADDPIADVVMRSAAAPSYLPAHQHHVDGGMFCHDPSSSALILAMSRLGKKPKRITMLSIGTGKTPKLVEKKSSEIDWGIMQWLPNLSNLLWDGQVQKSEETCRELLGVRYHRINPFLDKEIPLDSHSAIPDLTKVALSYDMRETAEWIRENYYEVGPSSGVEEQSTSPRSAAAAASLASGSHAAAGPMIPKTRSANFNNERANLIGATPPISAVASAKAKSDGSRDSSPAPGSPISAVKKGGSLRLRPDSPSPGSSSENLTKRFQRTDSRVGVKEKEKEKEKEKRSGRDDRERDD